MQTNNYSNTRNYNNQFFGVDFFQKKCIINNDDYFLLAYELATILQIKKNIKITPYQICQWTYEIKKLVEYNNVSTERVQAVLDWYWNNIEKENIPLIESGRFFRLKFTSLENIMKKENKKYFKNFRKDLY